MPAVEKSSKPYLSFTETQKEDACIRQFYGRRMQSVDNGMCRKKFNIEWKKVSLHSKSGEYRDLSDEVPEAGISGKEKGSFWSNVFA